MSTLGETAKDADRLRIAIAPAERELRKVRYLIQMFWRVAMIVAALVFAGNYLRSAPLLSAGLVILAVVLGFYAAGASAKRSALSRLWEQWPVERAEAEPKMYRLARNNALNPTVRYDVVTMIGMAAAVVVAASAAIGAEGFSPVIFPIVVVFAGPFAWSGYQRWRSIGIAERGIKVIEAQGPGVVYGLSPTHDLQGTTAVKPVGTVGGAAQILWRGTVAHPGSQRRRTMDGVRSEKYPQDALVVTSEGLHLVNVVEPAQPWDVNTGIDTLTDVVIRDASSDGLAVGKLPGQVENKFDKIVAEHGYPALVDADSRNVIHPRRSIRRAWVKMPRRVGPIGLDGATLHIESIDGSVSRWHVVVMVDCIEGLQQALTSLQLGNE